ncbi:transketolase [Streptomyces sp. B3I7]|nr:transketolase [Streptomyces sp. B3I7]
MRRAGSLTQQVADESQALAHIRAVATYPVRDVTTGKASAEVLAALYPVLPELRGGSADLAESNSTAVKGEASFLPESRQSKMWSGGPYGRTLHSGIGEHAMGAVMNGIALHGGTFLTFSDYMRGALRPAALMQLPSLAFLQHGGRRGRAGADVAVRERELLAELWNRREIAGPALNHAARNRRTPSRRRRRTPRTTRTSRSP